jgi:hypothetical protein
MRLPKTQPVVEGNCPFAEYLSPWSRNTKVPAA